MSQQPRLALGRALWGSWQFALESRAAFPATPGKWQTICCLKRAYPAAVLQSQGSHCSNTAACGRASTEDRVSICLSGWLRCCVQRIARRSKVLAEERVALLEAIGFDWTGADALS